MENFTPLSATIGGALIGLAATVLWTFAGRTAGVSGIFGGLFPQLRGDVAWRLAFLVGIPVGAALGAAFAPRALPEVSSAAPTFDIGQVGLVVAGLLVGLGTRLGRGCTSGHGVCGLARLSVRSLVAVAIFMAVAALVVYATRHGL